MKLTSSSKSSSWNSLTVLSFLPTSQQRSGFLLSYSPIRNYRTYLIIRSYQALSSRCGETCFLKKLACWISDLRTSRTPLFILMGQKQMYSKTSNSLISVPARSHVIFALKTCLLRSKLYTKYIRLKISFGNYGLASAWFWRTSYNFFKQTVFSCLMLSMSGHDLHFLV